MDGKSLEFKVGLTIFLAAAILVFGIMWFQGFEMNRKTFVLYAVFPMVGGIDKGDEVSINGVEKGEVRRVELRGRKVLVKMKIDEDVRVPEDSRATLQTIGVMGERIVTIVLGESENYLGPGATIQGTYDPGISEALAYMGHLMEDLRSLTGNIREIADALTEGGNLKMTVENLASITEELRSTISETTPELKAGVSSFRSSAAKVDGLLERNAGRLDTIIVTLEGVSRELPELFDKIGNVADALARIAKRLESDDSTLGALVQDRELMNKLEQAITNLDVLIMDIQANPKKYLKVEIF